MENLSRHPMQPATMAAQGRSPGNAAATCAKCGGPLLSAVAPCPNCGAGLVADSRRSRWSGTVVALLVIALVIALGAAWYLAGSQDEGGAANTADPTSTAVPQ